MRLKLGGKYWNFRYGRTPRDCWGLCDSTVTPKTITVRKNIGEFNKLDTAIHEFLHAIHPHMEEEWIEQTGTELAHALWRLGYRANGGKQ